MPQFHKLIEMLDSATMQQDDAGRDIFLRPGKPAFTGYREFQSIGKPLSTGLQEDEGKYEERMPLSIPRGKDFLSRLWECLYGGLPTW